jgi:predicted nuclease of predicted toxin-antitoxin system
MPSLHRARHRYFRPLTSASMKEARSEWSRLPKTRFLMDANMEPWALYVMRYRRWDVRPCDFANLRRSDDQAVFAAAWRLKRLLITHDSDFLDDRLFPFASCSGLLVLPTYDSVSMQYANLLAGACELVSRGARLWFHTKIVARRDFTVKVRNWEKSHGHIAEWQYWIAPGYRKAASDNS